jgi:anhydro-N-acetylmuramic acid kinase
MGKLKNRYTAIGLMSGTSLDGLDAALCEFTFKKGTWDYKIKEAETFAYDKNRKKSLQNAAWLNALEFWKLHTDFGKFSGQTVQRFLKGKKHSIDVIASHGHTVFHQPEKGFTCQIGDGASIAALTGYTTACDFRSTDVALGGQGAPLVPLGDELLFTEYDACLNIGGIANISFTHKKQRLAFDICPANLVFNFYAAKAGMNYDKGGKLAAKGKVNQTLLKKLNGLSFYKNL